MDKHLKTKEFISYLESKGFTDTTKPKYVIESFDEIVTNSRVEPDWYDFEKPRIKISISSDNTCYIKCKVKDTTVVPYREKEYQGYLDSYGDNDIILKYKGGEAFGARYELPTVVRTNSVYTISLPK